MAKQSILLDESVETPEVTETEATQSINLRPQVDLPGRLRIFGTTFWPASETKQAQYSGYSHELGCYGRIYGDLAEKVHAHYGASKVSGEETGQSVSLTITTYPGSNGLFFQAQTEDQRDYISLNEYSIDTIEAWVPSVKFK